MSYNQGESTSYQGGQAASYQGGGSNNYGKYSNCTVCFVTRVLNFFFICGV
jgi:hypothetical protein